MLKSLGILLLGLVWFKDNCSQFEVPLFWKDEQVWNTKQTGDPVTSQHCSCTKPHISFALFSARFASKIVSWVSGWEYFSLFLSVSNGQHPSQKVGLSSWQMKSTHSYEHYTFYSNHSRFSPLGNCNSAF